MKIYRKNEGSRKEVLGLGFQKVKGLSIFHVGNPSGSAQMFETGSQMEHGDK